jgi:flagellar export protein FliJ
MRRYEFSLASVLRARRAQEDVARSSLQKANLAAAAAELAANASLAHYHEVAGSTDMELRAHHERAGFAAGGVIGARESLVGARAEVTKAMNEYLAASKDVSVLERLDDRRREEHALEAQRQEAAEIDDLVLSRHVRRRDKAEERGGGAP